MAIKKSTYLCILALLSSLTAAAATPPTVVFIGDDATANWSNIFAAHPNWINKGIDGLTYGGQNSFAVLARFQSDVVSLHPAIVHIMVGAADANTVDDGVVQFWLAVYENDIKEMVAEAKAANIKVILGTIAPEPYGTGVFFGTYFQQVNTFLETYGAANGIPVVNYHDVLCGCIGANDPNAGALDPTGFSLNPYFGSGLDSTTLSAAGYAAMTPLVENAIAEEGLTLKSGHIVGAGNVNAITVGEGIAFTAYGLYSDGVTRPMLNTNFAGMNGTWTSSNPAALYVGINGQTLAIGPGKVSVSFTSLSGVHFSPWIVTVSPQDTP